MSLQELNITAPFVAMFDEYDEGTAIAKAAENSSMIPTNQYFLTLNEDGVDLSSDFYLRLAQDGMRLVRRQITAAPNGSDTPPTRNRLPLNDPVKKC